MLEWAALASNPHAADDPIDVAILRSFASTFGEAAAARKLQAYTVSKFVGFTPETKRSVAYARRGGPGAELKAAKGLIDKVLETGADGGDEWACAGAGAPGSALRAEVERVDADFSRRGYKTLGVCVARADAGGALGEMEFVGVVPMLDPPREDTKRVVARIRELGVGVKMVTGDHANIARETARQIGMRTDILRRDVLADGAGGRTDAERAAIIEAADGFAQVMPKDKNLVVRALQERGFIVGMTGDGVNDAPALQQAHIGVAVEGATDAARNASDIILTAEGLAPIATAIVESRKIFQRVRSYVLYRIAATIQIVLVLSLLIFAYDQQVKALYIILLALFNDVTMITVSYDTVTPSPRPEVTDVPRMLRTSVAFGLCMTCQSILFYVFGEDLLSETFRDHTLDGSAYTQAVIYLQVSIAIEMLIFATRVEGPFYSSAPPIASLAGSVLLANVGVTLLVCSGLLGPRVSWADAAIVWGWDIAWFLAMDAAKRPTLAALDRACGDAAALDREPATPRQCDPPPLHAGDGLAYVFCSDFGATLIADGLEAARARAFKACCGNQPPPAASPGTDVETFQA